jgi:SNF2 family DNA or RNA helicase
MSQKQRDKAIESFTMNPGVMVMVSTKSGSAGLNLTVANRVITVDPWWNSCTERQQFGRIYRISQEKETFLTRLIVKEAIDERIYKMQNKKDALIIPVMKTEMAREDQLRLLNRKFDDE